MSDLTPLVLGNIFSPLPLITLIALLLTPLGLKNGLAFVATRTAACLVYVLVMVFLPPIPVKPTHETLSSRQVLVVNIILAGALLVASVVLWRQYSKNKGVAAKDPSWLKAVDSMTPLKSAGIAAFMSVTEGITIALNLEAGQMIARSSKSHLAHVFEAIAYALLASSVLIICLILVKLLGQKGKDMMVSFKKGITSYQSLLLAAVVSILCVLEFYHVFVLFSKATHS